MIFLYLYAASQLENYLKKQFNSFILLSFENSSIIHQFIMPVYSYLSSLLFILK